MKAWEIIEQHIAFDNPWQRIDEAQVRLPNGQVKPFYFAIKPDVVIVFALTKDNLVVVNNQYHIYFARRMPELVAGYIDDHEPLAAAQRELREEAGYTAAEWIDLGRTYLGRWDNALVYFFLARDAEKAGEQELEESEDIIITLETIADYKQKMFSGAVENPLSLLCSYKALQYLNEL